MAGSTLAARLADLSHAQLVEIAAAGCEASTEVKDRADALLAGLAVEKVLLSIDLVPHLLASLQLEDGAAAAVCSRWAEGWKATSEGRRRLRRVAFDFSHEDLLGDVEMAVVPGGAELVARSRSTVRILGRDMSTVSSFEMPTHSGGIATSEGFIYTIQADSGGIAASEEFIYTIQADCLRCFTRDGTEVTKYEVTDEDPDRFITCPVLGPGGLLFCLLDHGFHDELDEIVALDAQTLQPRYRFGLSLLNYVRGMVLVGEELFVCDTGNDRLQVFSLAGEHRRSITGEWKRPMALCFVKDRLYLLEEPDEDEQGEPINPLPGGRISVLSLQGDTLHVYTHPDGGQNFSDLYYFDGKLLAVAPLARVQDAVVALCGV